MAGAQGPLPEGPPTCRAEPGDQGPVLQPQFPGQTQHSHATSAPSVRGSFPASLRPSLWPWERAGPGFWNSDVQGDGGRW